jgi:hypothetical protein
LVGGETAEADESGALGEGVEDGGESVGERRRRFERGWESGDECEQSGEGENESELKGVSVRRRFT